MKLFKVRFGFVSTYKETVFLKISRQENSSGGPGGYALYYSDILKHSSSTMFEGATGMVSQVSLRLSLLFLLSRAKTDEKGCDSRQFQCKWTLKKVCNKIGLPGTYEESPKPAMTPYRKRHRQTPLYNGSSLRKTIIFKSDADSLEVHQHGKGGEVKTAPVPTGTYGRVEGLADDTSSPRCCRKIQR